MFLLLFCLQYYFCELDIFFIAIRRQCDIGSRQFLPRTTHDRILFYKPSELELLFVYDIKEHNQYIGYH